FEAAQQWWEMGHATNLAEFEAALRDIRIPMFTIMYTDRDGNILHVFNEQVPVRSTGDWDFWNGTTLLGGEISLIPGDTSEYLWERVYHPYEDLPRVLNPESGWLQNANEPPFTTTLPRPFEPEDFPPYMLPDPYIWPRPITSMRLLHEDESITYAELLEDKHSTFVELARLLLDDLIAAAATSDDELAQQAAAVLADWDRRADADSRGAVLFAAWANTHVSGFEAFASPWSLDNPIDSLSGLADPDAAVADLIDTAQQLEQLRALGVGMDVAYGDVFRLRFLDSGVDLPANGTEDLLGSFRILNFTQDDDLRFRPTQGDSYIAVVEFGETVQAQVLLAYGNATQSGNPHVGDQLELFAGQQLRPALLTREAIEADLNRAETLD
ncbi:MAG: penicillin acylase family protein, partial [Chloroflexota bacterium]